MMAVGAADIPDGILDGRLRAVLQTSTTLNDKTCRLCDKCSD